MKSKLAAATVMLSTSLVGCGTDTTVLQATVGSDDDPDAFDITLLDAEGEPVEELAAGSYRVEVRDLSSIHNFRLIGPGVDQATSVPETGEVTWEVTLGDGLYAFLCEPHPDMLGEIGVN